MNDLIRWHIVSCSELTTNQFVTKLFFFFFIIIIIFLYRSHPSLSLSISHGTTTAGPVSFELSPICRSSPPSLAVALSLIFLSSHSLTRPPCLRLTQFPLKSVWPSLTLFLFSLSSHLNLATNVGKFSYSRTNLSLLSVSLFYFLTTRCLKLSLIVWSL